MSQKYEMIKNVLRENGYLLLNSDSKHLNIMDLGGDWQDLVDLINSREGFITKRIKHKTTILSRKAYFSLKSRLRKEPLLTDTQSLIYDFVLVNGNVNSILLKQCLPISKKEIDKSLAELQNILLVSVIGESRRIKDSWGEYIYSTSSEWEQGVVNDSSEAELEMEYEKIKDKVIGKTELNGIGK